MSTSGVLATIVVERLLDVLAVVGLALVVTLAMPIPSMFKQAALVAGGIGVLATVGIWWMAGHSLTSSPETTRGQELVGIWVARLSLGNRDLSRLMGRAVTTRRSFGHGLAAIGSPRQMLALLGYSALSWVLSVGVTVLVMRSSGLSLPLISAILVVVAVNLGGAVPSSPGALGIVHFVTITALLPWGVDQTSALGFAVVLHGVTFIITSLMGLLSLWVERIGLKFVAPAGVEP